jgi:hypothetical protein
MIDPIWIIPLMIVLIVTLLVLDRVLRRMEDKGWIYYRRNKPRGTMRGLLGGVEEFMHPEIRHVREDESQRTEQRRDADPSKQ